MILAHVFRRLRERVRRSRDQLACYGRSLHRSPSTMIDPPSNLLLQIANNPSAEDFRGSFAHVRDTVTNTLSRAGFEFGGFDRTLDFGCGVGRFLFSMQPLLRDGQQLLGCDIDADCARWCQEHIDFAAVEHSGLYPPLPYETASIDFVYALSVFTHLRIDLQFRWAWELHRILAPGGALFFTTHGPCFMSKMLEQARSGARTQLSFAVLGDDGLFLNKTMAPGDGVEGQREVAVAHDSGAVDLIFSSFERRLYVPRSNMAGSQDIHVFQKPQDAVPIALPEGMPDSLALSSEIGKGGDSGRELRLRFELSSQRRFSAFARVPKSGTYQIAFDIEIQDTGSRQTLAEARVTYNETEVFGDAFYCPLVLDIPPHEGPVDVRVVPVMVNRHLLSARKSVATMIELAHFE